MESCVSFESSHTDYVRHLEEVVKQLCLHHQHCIIPELDANAHGPLVRTPAPSPTSGFQSIEYEFTKKKPRNRGVAKWKRAANELIAKTPRASRWWTELASIDVDTLEQHGRVISFFLNGELSVSHLQPTRSIEDAVGVQPSCLVRCVESYAQICVSRGKHTAFAVMLVRFQTFLLVCLCVVLKELEQPREEIYQIMRISVVDGTDRYLDNIMRAVIWMNEVVDDLDINGWNDRATYLLLICKCGLVQRFGR